MNISDAADPEEGTLRARSRLVSRLNTVINRFADRDDLVLACLWQPPLAGEAPAWYESNRGRVVLNARVGLRGAHPDDVNPLTRVGRRRHPEIIGLLAHEASHAHSTDMTASAQEFRRQVLAEDPLLLQVMTLLEEPRVEYRQVQRRPHDRYYLRAQSVMIDLGPFSVDAEAAEPGMSRWNAACVALMVCGRIEAGILKSYDAEGLLPALTEALGAQSLEQLRAVLRRTINLDDGDLTGLLESARQWLHVTGRPSRDTEAQELAAALYGCGGSDGEDGEDDWAYAGHEEATPESDGVERPELGSGEVLTDVGDSLNSLADEVATEIANDVAALNAAEAAEAAQGEAAQDRKQEARDAAKGSRVAASVFAPGKDSQQPVLKDTRNPTGTERQMAQAVGRALKKAQARDRSVTKSSSVAPPGRLDGREAMLGAAQRSRGAVVTARPFQQRRSQHAPEPPITLGLLADYSGSMAWAAKALSSVTWVFAHAMTHVTGTTASALFASRVVALSRPRELPAQVQEYAANSGGHSFGRAHHAINGALNLTRGQGVRLLVVVSDAHYGGGKDQADMERALADLKRAGVSVLWVGIDGPTDFPEDAIPVPIPKLDRRGGSEALVELMVSTITEALVKELNSYS